MNTLNDIFKEQRQTKPTIFGQHSVYDGMGIIDNTVPTEQRVRRDFRGIFFRCLEMRADSLADAMTQVFVERQAGQDEFEPTELSHPWYQLIKNPSMIYPSRELWQWASLEFDLSGKADFIIERGANNMPIQMLPIYREFGYMEPAPSIEGGVSHWIFYRSDGKIVRIDKENAIRIHRASPWSPYESISLIEAARFELDTTASMKKYRTKSVETGGFTSDILLTDQELGQDQHKQLAQELKKFVGNRGHGRVAIFDHGAKPYSPISAKDLEYINGEQQTDKSIMIICGIPPGLFESTTTRATAEGAQVVFAQQTVSKLVTRFCEQVTHQFEIVFNADKGVLYIVPPDVVPLDKDFELRQRQVYLSTGLRTHNDYLSSDGFDEVPEGNGRYIPFGWNDITQSQTEPQRAVRKINSDDRAQIWRAVDKKKRRQAELVKPALNQFYNEAKSQVLKQIEDEYERSFTQDALDNLNLEFKLLEILTPEVIRMLQAGFNSGIEMAGVTGLEFTLNSPFIENQIKSILQQQMTIPLTLSEEVTEVLKKGIEEKLTKKELGQAISQWFEGWQPGKVENIANGLSTTTWESGQEIAFNEAGIEETEWLSSRDGKVRPSHEEADGQRAPMNGFFDIGGEELKYPGDPNGSAENTIGCRCIRIPIT